MTFQLRRLGRLALVAKLFITALVLGGCGGGTGTTTGTESGEVVIGLTDAEGDFATYTVDVLSLTLTRADGLVVDTLPLSTRVDFARYTELTEFLTVATVPAGTYVKASMVLDYGNADIQVEDAAGDIVPVTVVQDMDGNPIDTLEVSVRLEDRHQLTIVPGVPANLTLDFDLEASNRVSFAPPEVIDTVAPFLVADVSLERPKVHRLRGPLNEVDVANDSFSLLLRPFHHRVREHRRHFGTLKVLTNDDTVYEIDGVNYQGEAGLAVLDAQPKFTATIVMGELRFRPRRFVAREVYAGSSVPGGELDVVKGNVIARSGDTLTLKGATLVRADGTVVFNDEVRVELAPTTRVTKQLSTASHDIGEISVGQRLTVFGALSGDAISGYTLDAADGLARMHLTTVAGSVVQTDAPLALDLQRIDRRRVSLFDFSGTGVDAANDADPDFYEINAASLTPAGLAVNDPLKVRGFVRAFGQAPEDFDAQTVIQVADLPARLSADWDPASATAVSEITDSGMTLDLAGAGAFHHVSRGGVLTDLTLLADQPRIEPRPDGEGLFLITGADHSTTVHGDFGGFAADLAARLDGGARVRLVHAHGEYADDSGVLTSRRVHLWLE